MGTFAQDLRYALRTLRQSAGFSAVAVVVLALGIGATTAIGSAVHAILIRPLPYAEPERLVAIWPERFATHGEVLFLQEQARSFSGVSMLSPGWGMPLTQVEEPTQLQGAKVSVNLFSMLGVGPVLGRTFAAEEGVPGADRVAVLSDSLWRDKLGADPSILGRHLVLDGVPHAVIGVMPPGFEVLQAADLWVPLAADPTAWYHRGNVGWAIARVAEGLSAERAAEEIRSLTPRLEEETGQKIDLGQGPALVALQDKVVGDLRPALLALLGAVAFILLITAANVAHLVLTRATKRRGEIAVRMAMGARPGRVVRQLLTESAVLAFLGGLGGLILAVWGVELLRGALPPDTARLAEVAVDLRTLGIGLGTALLALALFGLVPAWMASRGELRGALGGGRGFGGGSSRLRGALVAAEVGLALLLAIGAGLMVRTLWNLYHVDPGFERERTVTLRLQPSGPRYEERSDLVAFYDEILDRAAALPGVEAAGATLHLPLSGYSWDAALTLEARPWPEGTEPPHVAWRTVTEGYFQAMGIALVSGRRFSREDGAEGVAVAVVNRAMARRFWPGESPLGRRLKAGHATANDWVEVVGVVADVRHRGLTAEPEPELYRPFRQRPAVAMSLVVRAAVPPEAFASQLRELVWAVDGEVPVSAVQTLEQAVVGSVARPRVVMRLLAAFAGLGVLLSALGIYGVTAYSVAQQRREIGVRLALGARRPAILGLVVGQGVRWALLGIAVGLGSALVATRALGGLLFGLGATDPPTFLALAAGLLAVATLASLLPALRATRMDPTLSLREE